MASRKNYGNSDKQLYKYGSFSNNHHDIFDKYVQRAFGDDFFDDDFGSFGNFGFGLGNRGGNRMIGSRERDDDGLGFFGGFGSNIMSEFGQFNNLRGSGNAGSCITKSYVSSIKYDSNGKPQKQEFSSQSINQINKDGTKISESKHAFADSEQGVKKASHQRMINDQGHKIVKVKDYKKNEDKEEHYYKGFDEAHANEFHDKFNDISKKSNFDKNYRIMESLPMEKRYISNSNTNNNSKREPLKLSNTEHRSNNYDANDRNRRLEQREQVKGSTIKREEPKTYKAYK